MTGRPAIVQVSHGSGTSPVYIQPGLIETVGPWLAPHLPRDHVVVVSDDRVWQAQGERLLAGCQASGIALMPLIVPAGEDAKSWERLIALVDQLLAHGIERGDAILAFGGGVVGDLAGFAAAILKRGCKFIQVPTSLLAQVDSSVGGKTGINTKAGKNLVGAFHQPAAVFIDPEALDTLPGRHIRAGYAEIVKYGLIGDADFFGWCEQNGPALIAGDPALRTRAILKSVEAKAAIVRRDERETMGERALLNLGHSFGHALEAETGFGDVLLHGEAVSAGLALALRFSAMRGFCAQEDAKRVAAHLGACGLPTRLFETGVRCDGARLAAHMRHDKKTTGGQPTLVLVKGIGAAFLEPDVPLDEIAAFLDNELAEGAQAHAALR